MRGSEGELRDPFRAAIAGMQQAPLSDRELAALQMVLLEQGAEVTREAQIELLLTAIWYRSRSTDSPRHD